MRIATLPCLALALAAQDGPPVEILRGELLEWDSGELSLRGPDHRVQRCAFNERTYLERDKKPVLASTVQPGQQVELVADRRAGAGKCLALTVYLLTEAPIRKPPATRLNLLASRSFLDGLMPRGNLTFAGIVVRLTPDRLVLKTRAHGEAIFLIREDTSYAANGLLVTASLLPVNTRVFVRAGRTFDGDIEAYQVVWGDILKLR